MAASDAPAPQKPRRSASNEALVLAFLENPRTEDAARAAGCSARTARRWKADPEHWAEVIARRGELLDHAVAKLRRALPKVTDRLVLLALENEDPAIAVRASVAALDAYSKLSAGAELDQRLSALEQHLRAAPFRTTTRPTLLAGPVETNPQSSLKEHIPCETCSRCFVLSSPS
jgi:deoxyribodipyrimidine photolyase